MFRRTDMGFSPRFCIIYIIQGETRSFFFAWDLRTVRRDLTRRGVLSLALAARGGALGLGDALEGRPEFGERVRESGDRRDSRVHLLAVDLVERVVGRVVDVEVPRDVLDRRKKRHAGGAQGAHVRAPASLLQVSDSERLQDLREDRERALRRGTGGPSEPGHAPGAAVALDRGDVGGQLARVRLRVGTRPREAVLLVG